jgi:hypothetical protein
MAAAMALSAIPYKHCAQWERGHNGLVGFGGDGGADHGAARRSGTTSRQWTSLQPALGAVEFAKLDRRHQAGDGQPMTTLEPFNATAQTRTASRTSKGKRATIWNRRAGAWRQHSRCCRQVWDHAPRGPASTGPEVRKQAVAGSGEWDQVCRDRHGTQQ